MMRRLLFRAMLAGLAALGTANESAAKVVHGMTHLEEAQRARVHPAIHNAPGANAGHALAVDRGVENSDPEPGHNSLHATVVAPEVAWSGFIGLDAERVATQPLVVVASRSVSDEVLAQPPGRASPPSLPRAPPTA